MGRFKQPTYEVVVGRLGCEWPRQVVKLCPALQLSARPQLGANQLYYPTLTNSFAGCLGACLLWPPTQQKQQQQLLVAGATNLHRFLWQLAN